ncbi:hypothetical protein K438DRAFT_1831687 [Mycena galopus ATCC 62051]|nr:hypothetical protein K438DRAFT_1831687 [Mycena galopus ATCC 62051]
MALVDHSTTALFTFPSQLASMPLSHSSLWMSAAASFLPCCKMPSMRCVSGVHMCVPSKICCLR